MTAAIQAKHPVSAAAGARGDVMNFLLQLDAVPSAVWHQRKRLGLSLREAADEMGISFNTLTRMEHGQDVRVSMLRAAAAWIDHDRVASAPTEGEPA